MRAWSLGLLLLSLLACPAGAGRAFVGPVENVPSLVALTRSETPAFRAGGVFAIGILGGRAAPAAGGLVRRLEDPARQVRREAAWALVRLGEASVEPLRAALRDPNPRLRIRAARVLGALGRRARPALPDLREAVEASDRRVRFAAFRAIRRIRGRRW